MMTWAPCPHGVRTRGKKISCQLLVVCGILCLVAAAVGSRLLLGSLASVFLAG